MPLFSRRALQSLITEAAEVIPLEKRRQYANSFNGPVDFQAVASEWELAMYRPLRALGEVVHEPPLGGSSAVDYLLASKDRKEDVAIEVTCVSAKAEEEANPIEAFQRELRRRLKKVGRTGSGWKLKLGTRDDEPRPRSELVYAIPPRSGLAAFFGSEAFRLFEQRIRKAPGRDHSFRQHDTDADVSITYLATSRFLTTSATGKGHTLALEKSSGFECLRAKYRQLRSSGFHGPCGVILCDGGSRLFQTQKRCQGRALREVVEAFWRKHPNLSFVAAAYAHWNGESLCRSRPRLEVYSNPAATHPVSGSFLTNLVEAASEFPVLVSDGINALHAPDWHVPRWSGGESFSLEVNRLIVRFPAKNVLAALAGGKLYPGIAHSSINPLAAAYERGWELLSARVIPGDEEDWLELQFGQRVDPAYGPIDPGETG